MAVHALDPGQMVAHPLVHEHGGRVGFVQDGFVEVPQPVEHHTGQDRRPAPCGDSVAARPPEAAYLALRAWLRERRATWPNTPNRHVLISKRTALGVGPVSDVFVKSHSTRLGIDLERIRGDRVLHEALTVEPDPLT